MTKYNPGRLARRTPDTTRYVRAVADLPVTGSGENALLTPEVFYQLEKDIYYQTTLEVQSGASNTIAGLNFLTKLEITTIYGFEFISLTLTGARMPDIGTPGPGGGDPVFDMTGQIETEPFPPVPYRGNVVIEQCDFPDRAGIGSFQYCGTFTMRDCRLSGNRATTTFTNMGVIRMFDNQFDAPPFMTDTQFKFMDDAEFVAINSNVFRGLTGQTMFYFDPLLTNEAPIPGVTTAVVFVGNTVIGGQDFFEVGDEDEITAFTDNLDGTITISTAATGSLANGDTINILRTENYNGGYVVSNVVANTSFDITATYVDNPGRGTWHSGSLDQRDSRVTTRGNAGIKDSRKIFFGHDSANAAATTIAAISTWYPLNMSGFHDHADITERFALTGDGTAGKFVYTCDNDFKGLVSFVASVVTGTAAAKDYEFGISINGAAPTDEPTITVAVGNSLVNLSLISAKTLSNGDTVQVMVRQNTLTPVDITIEDFVFVGQDSH